MTMTKTTRTFLKFKEPGEYSTLFAEQPPRGEPLIIGKLSVQNWLAAGAEEITVTLEVAEAAKPATETQP